VVNLLLTKAFIALLFASFIGKYDISIDIFSARDIIGDYCKDREVQISWIKAVRPVKHTAFWVDLHIQLQIY
jgi:hypothetical protein